MLLQQPGQIGNLRLKNRIVMPADAEAVFASGSADFVSVGRALYADPHWALKAFGEVKAPIRECIACNVCFERLTLEKDVSCVQNPMVGTEFEAARVARGRGQEVEVWEKAQRVGGQIHLAVAAPDKTEVQPVWDYRWSQLTEMKVPVKCGVDANAAMIKAFKPDFVVVATGSVPKAPPMDTQALASDIAVMHAWDVFTTPECIAPGAVVTVIGGGMVGVEVADLLRLKGCDIQVLEMQATAANGMARNNKFELLERVVAAGVRIVTNCRIEQLSAWHLTVKIGQAASSQLAIGQALIFANGPRSNTEVVAAIEEVGVPYALVGDCHAPGDFLSAIRDGWMVALGIDQQHFSGRTV